MEFWLENISKERIKERRSTSTGNGNVNVNALKDNLNLCTAKVEQVEKKLWELTNSPLPAYQDKVLTSKLYFNLHFSVGDKLVTGSVYFPLVGEVQNM